VQFLELQKPRDLDLDLGSSHTAYRRALLIDLYLHTKLIRKKTFYRRAHGLPTDEISDPPLMLLGRLGGVDLKYHIKLGYKSIQMRQLIPTKQAMQLLLLWRPR